MPSTRKKSRLKSTADAQRLWTEGMLKLKPGGHGRVVLDTFSVHLIGMSLFISLNFQKLILLKQKNCKIQAIILKQSNAEMS